MSTRGQKSIPPAAWTLVLFATLGAFLLVTTSLFFGWFRSSVPVTLTAERTGLVMEPGGKVKMRGFQVGRVGAIDRGAERVDLRLEIFPGQAKYIPENVSAQIRATTAFGAKYVDLIYPDDPSPQRIKAGAVIRSENVSTEVNTVFQNLTGVLQKIDPAKLNGVLSALAQGLRGQGERLGEAVTGGNEVLAALNSRAETIRGDWQSVRGFSDTYGAAAQDIVEVLDSVSATSSTITDNAQALDALLVNVTGLAQGGINLLGPNKDNLVKAINVLEPTTSLLMKYNPQLTCMLVGGQWFLDNGGYEVAGGNGKSAILDVAILPGEDQYHYPQHLPINGAKGGPGGAPGCGSLPIVDDNWPKRALVTNTGWGRGLDLRPNPGIGFPGYANYLPGTRGVPEPPSVRNLFGGPAIGPVPYPGAPPYGAAQYAPDGTPLYPGLPPGVPSDSPPPDPNKPLPGTEPFVPPAPMHMRPTPLPPPPPPGAPPPP